MPAPAERRSISRLAIASFVLGGLLILWAILTVSAAGYGTNVRSEFSNRRPYDQIKREVHSAVPKAFVRALLGGWLIFMGVRSVKRGRS